MRGAGVMVNGSLSQGTEAIPTRNSIKDTLNIDMVAPRSRRCNEIFLFGLREWRCLLLTLLVVGCTVCLLWCSIMSLSASSCQQRRHLLDAALRESKALPTLRDRVSPEQASIETSNTTAMNGQAAAHTFTPVYCQPVHYCLMAFLLTMFYLVYLLECWNCQTRQLLTAAMNQDDMATRIRRAVHEEPTLWWIGFSYHFVRRVFQDGRRCRRVFDVRRCQNHHCRPKFVETARLQLSPDGGDASWNISPGAARLQPSAPFSSPPRAAHVLNATLQTCAYDKVITQVRQCFLDAKTVGGWEDRSPAICWTIDKPAVRVTFSKEFAFASDAYRLRYEEQRRSFERLQENEDDFLEIKEGFQVENENDIPSRVLLFPDKKRAPTFMRPKFFLLASLLLGSWPLRLLIYSQTAILHFSFRKRLGQTSSGYQSPESNPQMQPLKQHVCLLNAHKRHEIRTENNEVTVLENTRSKAAILGRHGRNCALSDTDDELLSIDIRFNPSASLGTSSGEGNH